MDQLKALLADAQAWFSRLTQRERMLVLGAGGGLLAFILFLVLFSFGSSADSTRRRIKTKSETLAKVQELAANYGQAEAARQDVERQLSGNNVRLISYLTEKGTAAGLEIPSITPKADVPVGDGRILESSAEMTLTDITLGKLVDFLGSIEQAPGIVKVKYLRIEPRVQNETLTAWVTVATYKMKP
jgi:general secretion pathway protein M